MFNCAYKTIPFPHLVTFVYRLNGKLVYKAMSQEGLRNKNNVLHTQNPLSKKPQGSNIL